MRVSSLGQAVQQLWREQEGAVLTTELVLVGAVLGIGVVAGLAGLRDSVVQELTDLSENLSQLNQTYSYSGLEGCSASTAGSHALDVPETETRCLELIPTEPVEAIGSEQSAPPLST